jgi:hypothetical protein
MTRLIGYILAMTLVLFLAGCGGSSITDNGGFQGTGEDNYIQAHMETVDNTTNLTIVSKNANVYQAEYNAGFAQGRTQKSVMRSARDNNWDNSYLTDPSHSFPKQIPPSPAELERTRQILLQNYTYTVNYMKNQKDPVIARNLKRVLFRLLGIYHGTHYESAPQLDLSGQWLPELSSFTSEELALGYETPSMTFMDVYYLNAYSDVMYVISYAAPESRRDHGSKCSAFVKKTDNDIYIAHNSWSGYLSQTMAFSLFVNDTFMTFNTLIPGMVDSATDFGYNNRGLMFNETTLRAAYSEPKIDALWMFWRITLAEQFASSIDEFFSYVSLEASGTYMNGYMVVDIKTNEIALIEMSYKNFIYYKPDGNGGYTIITKPEGISKEYDTELVQGTYILGINFPASFQIRADLQSTDNRPARRTQFLAQIGGVNDIESAKALITYTDPTNPLSIYGRWDLGYGDTPYPKTVPDGSLDAKAYAASMASYAMNLEGVFDLNSPYKSFWMKFGTAYVNGAPFIWSDSQWKGQKLRDVPDRLDGQYHLLNLYIR